MMEHNTVMKSLESEISRYEFQNAVDFFEGDKHVRHLTTKHLFSTLVYGQLTNSFSIRTMQHGLAANSHRLYHNGLAPIKRSTFADALRKRDYRIFQRIYETLYEKAQMLSGRMNRKFGDPLKIIDTTMIEVNVNRFPWANYRQGKGGMKLHLSYNSDTALPEQMFFTDGKTHDSGRFSSFAYQEGDIFVFDRAYNDHKSWYRMELNGGLFVTRLRKNNYFKIVEVMVENQTNPVRRDMSIRLTGLYASQNYPKPIRLVEYYDKEKDKFLRFLTNDFKRPAQDIADIYKARWGIELFFKWLKQNLKIKTFWGTSKNAVLTQIWVALIVYLLLWLIKMKNLVDYSLQTIRHILAATLLEKKPLEALFKPPPLPERVPDEPYLFGTVS